MKIEVDLDSIQYALDVISKTAPPAEGEVIFMAHKGKLKVASVAELSRCTVKIPCEVKGDGEFAIPLQSIKDAVHGHKHLQLTYAEGTLKVRSGKYAADLATVDVIPMDEISEEEKFTTWKITSDQASWLKKALKDVSLRPTTILSAWMPAGIRLTRKGGFVSCYDTQHTSWINTTDITGEFECVMNIDTMKTVTDVFHMADFTIKHGKSIMQIQNEVVKLIMSTPILEEDMPTLTEVRGMIKESMAQDATTFRFKKSDVTTFINNTRSVVGKERAELLVVGEGDGRVLLEVKTGLGTVRSRPKAKGTGEFRIDLEYITELAGKAEDEIKLRVVGDSFLSSHLKDSSIIVALNQKPAEGKKSKGNDE